MHMRFRVTNSGSPLGTEAFGSHRELYTALLDKGIKADQALLAALDVLTNIKQQSPYTCYGEGFTITSEAC